MSGTRGLIHDRVHARAQKLLQEEIEKEHQARELQDLEEATTTTKQPIDKGSNSSGKAGHKEQAPPSDLSARCASSAASASHLAGCRSRAQGAQEWC